MYLSGHLTLLLYSIGVPESRLYTFGRSSAPRTVLVAKKWGDDDATEALVEVANWVRNERGLTVLLDPNDPDGCRKKCVEGDGGEGVRMVMADGKEVMLADPDTYDCEPVMVDLVICLGGDGTVLRTIMWLESK
ncbi:hypothetical protein Pmar_PMAR005051 [Perkinsus marinus ATCC 50983]|uniref:NAD(+) kinase n=1 Tax=Perkinsus marinus (strain ATCC 50983 / TXsc) TaxID=423536 RepID=C5K460_PERM5|nr:hypothetical protein Pmar_PMAR005051 [Perkinsus marinus ATCC 50983]EER20733.1 hypothetical protein Pmar_PMAR005051 [Perkinsus marinus ATCC 50983]|eukprot:XP_002788937.1 hypothetical protein Pmar_PMAR005051 [Perkinsus marinus ATCC 50983]